MNIYRKSLFIFALALAPVAAVAHCGACGASAASKHKHSHDKADIVDTAVKAGDFTILAKALTEAGLVKTLKGDGPFTVFAPTDEAFNNLPDGTLESLLKPENKDQLIAILTYHVVSGEVTSDQVVQLSKADTVQGNSVRIKVKDGAVYVDDAKVIKTDIETSNGVIHVINKVILPS